MVLRIGYIACTATFEQGEKYEGKILHIQGEYVPMIKEFHFNRSDLFWKVYIDKRTVDTTPVEEHLKDELIELVQSEALKKGKKLLLWK